MEGIDLENKRFCVFGLQGTGKSVLVKGILGETKDSFVYDVLREHKGFNRYLVTYRQVLRHNDRDPAVMELNGVVNRVVIKSGQVRMFVLEEGNRYCAQKPYPLPSAILDLNDFQRHERIAFGVVARRPSQLNSDLVELAHYLFIFRLVGKNDREYLNMVAENLGDEVRSLPDFHFMVVYPDRSFKVHKPIPYNSKAITETNLTRSMDVVQ